MAAHYWLLALTRLICNHTYNIKRVVHRRLFSYYIVTTFQCITTCLNTDKSTLRKSSVFRASWVAGKRVFAVCKRVYRPVCRSEHISSCHHSVYLPKSTSKATVKRVMCIAFYISISSTIVYLYFFFVLWTHTNPFDWRTILQVGYHEATPEVR